MRYLEHILPALAPSWRFFDEIRPSPRIDISTDGQNWEPLTEEPQSIPIARRLRHLFWNPARNEALYHISLAERIIDQGDAAALAQLRDRAGRMHHIRLSTLERRAGSLHRETIVSFPPA